MNDTSDYWQKKLEKYGKTDWASKPNIFAEQALDYLPSTGTLLDLGAGTGQDSNFFLSHGFEVTSFDLTTEALKVSGDPKLEIIVGSLANPLPFEQESFDVVYAHLSLHYFDAVTTDKVFAEIARVLKPNGVLAFFTNSTSDPDYGEGEKLEDDFYLFDGIQKRYFTVGAAQGFANKYFEEVLADNNGETYKDSEKGVHNLIRYIGKKK